MPLRKFQVGLNSGAQFAHLTLRTAEKPWKMESGAQIAHLTDILSDQSSAQKPSVIPVSGATATAEQVPGFRVRHPLVILLTWARPAGLQSLNVRQVQPAVGGHG
jgi:hypothetical protein